AKTADCGNLMVEEEVAAVVVGSLAAGESAWNPIHDAGVPMMFYGAGGEALRDPDSTFSLGDPYAGTIGVPLQLAKDEGVDKVTAVVIDVPPALTVPQTIAPGIFEEAGIDWEVVTVPPGTADMTPQMQNVVDGDPGIVFVLGNDGFCIAAFNGLRSVGYDGKISAISQCVTDATRTAVPADLLDGMVLAASAPIGTDNPSTQLYNAVMETYGTEDIDTSRISGYSMFTAVAGFQAAVQDITGDITPENVITTIKAMPERELPGAGGLMFRCNGNAYPDEPATCVRGGLSTTLD
nr:ABC transporter substrate-binding protein [Micromonospora sp. DSM 115978]